MPKMEYVELEPTDDKPDMAYVELTPTDEDGEPIYPKPKAASGSNKSGSADKEK